MDAMTIYRGTFNCTAPAMFTLTFSVDDSRVRLEILLLCATSIGHDGMFIFGLLIAPGLSDPLLCHTLIFY